MTVQKRAHYEERIAHANGAEIECLSSGANPLWITLSEPTGLEHRKYRIKPDCEYAIEEIRRIGGNEAVEYYLYWLKGGELEYKADWNDWQWIMWQNNGCENPFKGFCAVLTATEIRKKKQRVREVLWIRCVHSTGINRKWLPEDETIKCLDWHRVPTCVREVEVD